MNQMIDCNVEYILPWRTIETINLRDKESKKDFVVYVLNDDGYLNVYLNKKDAIDRQNRLNCFVSNDELEEYLYNYEFHEIYTLLRVILDDEIQLTDFTLQQIEGIIYPVIKILREEAGGTHEYSYDNDLVIIKDQKEEIRIPVTEFTKQAKNLLSKLQEKTKGAFSIPEIEEFIKFLTQQS